MNTTKNIISVASHNNFQALDLALLAAGTAIALVEKVPPKLKSVADQLAVGRGGWPGPSTGSARRPEDPAGSFH